MLDIDTWKNSWGKLKRVHGVSLGVCYFVLNHRADQPSRRAANTRLRRPTLDLTHFQKRIPSPPPRRAANTRRPKVFSFETKQVHVIHYSRTISRDSIFWWGKISWMNDMVCFAIHPWMNSRKWSKNWDWWEQEVRWSFRIHCAGVPKTEEDWKTSEWETPGMLCDECKILFTDYLKCMISCKSFGEKQISLLWKHCTWVLWDVMT